MSDILEERYDCTCSAFFLNRKGLDAHLAEIQVQKTYHTTQLEKCFAHSRSDDDGHVCDGSCIGLCAACPHDACKPKSIVYKTKANLVRHYGIHVTCDEVCVFCCIRFEQTHKFLRHAEECHKKETGRKAQYMSYTCTELSSIVSHELHVAQHREISSDMNSDGKRARAVPDTDSGAMDTQRAEKVRIMDNGDQTTQVATQLSSSGQPNATFVGMAAGGGMDSVDIDGSVDMNNMGIDGVDMNGVAVMNRLDMNGLGDISSQLIYPSPVEGLRNFYYAPILQTVSSIPPAAVWSEPI